MLCVAATSPSARIDESAISALSDAALPPRRFVDLLAAAANERRSIHTSPFIPRAPGRAAPQLPASPADSSQSDTTSAASLPARDREGRRTLISVHSGAPSEPTAARRAEASRAGREGPDCAFTWADEPAWSAEGPGRARSAEGALPQRLKRAEPGTPQAMQSALPTQPLTPYAAQTRGLQVKPGQPRPAMAAPGPLPPPPPAASLAQLFPLSIARPLVADWQFSVLPSAHPGLRAPGPPHAVFFAYPHWPLRALAPLPPPPPPPPPADALLARRDLTPSHVTAPPVPAAAAAAAAPGAPRASQSADLAPAALERRPSVEAGELFPTAVAASANSRGRAAEARGAAEVGEEDADEAAPREAGLAERLARLRDPNYDWNSFRCEECSKTFTTTTGLRNHRRLHTGERPFKCEECGRAFADPSNLRRHIRSHTGERPYSCLQCGERFARNSALRRHATRFHARGC